MALSEYLLSACLAAVLSFVVVKFVQNRRYYQLGSKIPGPPGLPLLGNMIDLILHYQDVMDFIKDLHIRYGSVLKGWIGMHLAVVLTNPNDLAVIFNSSKTLSKPILYRPLTLVFGNSLLTAKTNMWKKYRKIMNPSFAREIIDSYASTFHEKSRAMADRLEKVSEKGPLDIVEYTMMCTLDIITETSLSVPVDIQGGNKQHCVITNFAKIAEIGSSVFFRPWLWFVEILKCSHLYDTISELVEPIREFVDMVVIRKKSELFNAENGSRNHDEDKPDRTMVNNRQGLLEHMLTTTVMKPELLSDEELRDQIIFVIGAATDTSAYTVAYTLMLLGLHQDVQMKVLRELEEIFCKDVQRTVTASDLKQMTYLEQVINETLRLYPPVPLIGRRVDEDVCIEGYILPVGTTVLIPIYLVHRDPTCFPDPDKFDPDRFKPGNTYNRPVCSFIPFTSGRRVCIGKNYAYMAMKTMLSVVLRRFEVLEYGRREDMEKLKFELVLKLVNGHKIKLRSRKLGCDV